VPTFARRNQRNARPYGVGPMCAVLVLLMVAGGQALPVAAQEPPGDQAPGAGQDQGQSEAGPAEAEPTRTRRPTRTPQSTATPTATPLPVGGVRLEVAIVPPSPSVGEAVQVTLRMVNPAREPAGELVFDIELPQALQVESVDAGQGIAERAGALVRWYMPRLDPAGDAVLTIGAIASRASSGARGELVCSTLISRSATAEHCTSFRIAGSTDHGAAAAGGAPTPFPTAPIGIGLADVVDEPPRVLAGWVLLVAGLAALGVWAGTSLRGRGGSAAPKDQRKEQGTGANRAGPPPTSQES